MEDALHFVPLQTDRCKLCMVPDNIRNVNLLLESRGCVGPSLQGLLVVTVPIVIPAQVCVGVHVLVVVELLGGLDALLKQVQGWGLPWGGGNLLQVT